MLLFVSADTTQVMPLSHLAYTNVHRALVGPEVTSKVDDMASEANSGDETGSANSELSAPVVENKISEDVDNERASAPKRALSPGCEDSGRLPKKEEE